jgi:undecaprenyl-diphosphatase
MGRGGRYGFPSSHAANVFAVWTLLATRHRKAAPYLLVIPLGVAYSRVYVGVHYPLDVLGGALLGVFLALGIWAISERTIKPLLDKRPKITVPSREKCRKDAS